jgi:hypothetical protein
LRVIGFLPKNSYQPCLLTSLFTQIQTVLQLAEGMLLVNMNHPKYRPSLRRNPSSNEKRAGLLPLTNSTFFVTVDLDDDLNWDFQHYSGATSFSGRIY